MLDLNATLQKAVNDAKAPGAVALVGNMERDLYLGAAGFAQTTPVRRACTVDTPYDLASLTKVMVTTTAVMMLRDEGRLDLDQPVGEIIPVPAFNRFTVRHLLTHTSGLPAHKIWQTKYSGLNEYVQAIAGEGLGWAPSTRRNYSDLGFILLAKVVELAGRDTLDQFAAKHIFFPLGMATTAFNPPAAWADTCAATENCPWRGKVLVGQVHDENAYAIGGVSGHAGLFSTAGDVGRFCRGLLAGKLVKEDTLKEMIAFTQCPPYPWQGLGWKMDPWMGGAEGFLPARRAFGHTGWTATCIWIDADTGNFATLLSNTCHPSRTSRFNRTLRNVFFKEVARQLYPKTTNAHLGQDFLVWKGYEPLNGKRAAVLTHTAATDAYGRQLLDVLRLREEVMLRYVYSPEHGFSGQAEAGERVASQRGTGAPIISLYGDRKAPSAEELRDIDYFVVDLQDVGARYYTYVATMKECLRACARAKKPVIVLDRPNPLGGAIMEGPVAQQTGSLVCWGAAPIRHAMTLGELATWFAETELKAEKPSVTVMAVDNWPSDFLHDQCALPWVPPSPNMPTFETALAYVGTCLLEGVNMNEGRGTDAPFLQFGAPWLDPGKVLTALDPEDYPGMMLGEWVYTPHPIPGKASAPRFNGELCRGIRMQITQPQDVRAFRTTIAILAAIMKRQPGQLSLDKFFDTLAGGPWLRQQLETGVPAAEIIAACAAQHTTFDRQRPKLYKPFSTLYA